MNLLLQVSIPVEWEPSYRRVRGAKAKGALAWNKHTKRDDSPTRLIVTMPKDETVFGRASEPAQGSSIGPVRTPTRESDAFLSWKKTMGVK